MKKMLCLLFLLPFLAGCSLFQVHKMDIEQGNILTTANISRIHNGMSPTEVKRILGTPLMVTLFDDNELAYVYTNQPGHSEMQIKKLRIIFKRGSVVSIEKNT
jgi:outer membrane protein assembly factor BamE